MTANLYLYTKPFIVVDSVKNRIEYLSDYLSDTERADEVKIREILFKFAVQEKLIDVIDNTPVHSIEDKTGSWTWAMNWLNFRSLVDHQQYGDLMSSLQSNSSYPINQILDLHCQLGILFDERLLNTIAHRTMKSIQLIPYDIPNGKASIEWDKIHQETPFIWVVILLQMVIRSTSTKVR